MNNKIKAPLLTLKFWVVIMAITGFTYYLLTKHGQHFFEYLPFLILLLCPLMHFFMHGKHHHNDKDPK